MELSQKPMSQDHVQNFYNYRVISNHLSIISFSPYGVVLKGRMYNSFCVMFDSSFQYFYHAIDCLSNRFRMSKPLFLNTLSWECVNLYSFQAFLFICCQNPNVNTFVALTTATKQWFNTYLPTCICIKRKPYFFGFCHFFRLFIKQGFKKYCS